jgi:hypothetical protein
LLALYRGEFPPTEAAAIEAEVKQSKRWQAHWDSLRYLDLERAAARSDAEALGHFEGGTRFCREVARTNGEVFLLFLRGLQESALGHSRKEWDRHVNLCVYCRRMRRLMQARYVCETHEVPEGEQLLREKLLEHEYREALDRITARLRQAVPEPIRAAGKRAGLTLVLHRAPKEFLPLLEAITRDQRPLVPWKGQAPRLPDVMEYLSQENVLDRLRREGVHDTLGLVLAEFCAEKGYAEASAVQATFTADRITQIEKERGLTMTFLERLQSKPCDN